MLVHADSGPTNDGRSALKDHVIARLVEQYGPIDLLFASQQQLLEIRSQAAHAALSHPGKWLDVGENGYLTNDYLADLCARRRRDCSSRTQLAVRTGIRIISLSCLVSAIPLELHC